MILTRLVKNLSITPVRYGSQQRKHKKPHFWSNYEKLEKRAQWEGGLQYKGFTYYPKPGEVDPPYEPTKLFMVQRTGDWKGTEYWYKSLLFQFKLDKEFPKSKVIIVKNTPANNAKLWKIKHLVKITPITFPDGEPQEGDVFSTHLNHKGELSINKRIDNTHVQDIIDMKPNPIQLKRLELKKQSLKVWEGNWKSPFDN